MIKEMLKQKLILALQEAKDASHDPAAPYEAGAAGVAGQCDGWVDALEWVLGAVDRQFNPIDIELVRIKYTEPPGGQDRTYSTNQMMRWEAEVELAHEAEMIAEGRERWPGVIMS